MSTIALHSTLNISQTVRDRGMVAKDHQQEMAYGLSNGRMTDDVTWPRKVKLVTPIRLERNISNSKTAGDRDSIPTTSREWHNYGLSKWSRDRWRQVTPKVLWGSTVGYPIAIAWLLVFEFVEYLVNRSFLDKRSGRLLWKTYISYIFYTFLFRTGTVLNFECRLPFLAKFRFKSR